MALSATDRAVWLQLLSKLSPGADASEVRDFWQDRSSEMRGELTQSGSHAQSVAGLVRVLPGLGLEEDERRSLLLETIEALKNEAKSGLEGPAWLRAHPAWSGVAVFEALSQLEDPQAVVKASDHTRSLFSQMEDHLHAEAGESAWAAAEVAAEVGWTDVEDAFMAYALGAPFSSPIHFMQVQIVQLMRLMPQGSPEVLQFATGIVKSPHFEELEEESQVQALWLAALLEQEHGSFGEALEHLEAALERIDRQAHPEVYQRVEDFRKVLTGGGGPHGQA